MPISLSNAHWILLAVSYASDANVAALSAISSAKPLILNTQLLLRILLTFLPESVHPDVYTDFVQGLSQRASSQHDTDVQVDWGATGELSHADVEGRLAALHLKRLCPRRIRNSHDAVLRSAPKDPVTLFILSRANAIEKETGLLTLVPSLVRPFLESSAYLRVWFTSTILPLLRFEQERNRKDGVTVDLETFESFDGAAGISILMSKSIMASREGAASADSVGKDLRETVGPWMYGSTQRKRRKLDVEHSGRAHLQGPKIDSEAVPRADPRESGFQNEFQIQPDDQLEDWQHTFHWMATTAVDNFDLAVKTLEGWRGPGDADVDDIDLSADAVQDDQVQSQLHIRYCQAALACIYAAECDGEDAARGAHSILKNVADLMGYTLPPALETDLPVLFTLEQQITQPPLPFDTYSPRLFEFNELLQHNQQLTTPTLEAFVSLAMTVHSAFVLANLGFKATIAQVAKLRFYGDEADSRRMVQKILRQHLTNQNTSERHWLDIRQQLSWLRDWNSGIDDPAAASGNRGVFAQLALGTLEREVLSAIGAAGHYSLVRSIYLPENSAEAPLDKDEVESSLLSLFKEFYEAASNGNRTRGSMKRASDLLAAFQSSFSSSASFRKASALVAATHSLSFYALTLEPGQPTAPHSIRDHRDPLGLIATVLSQHSESYTKLEDLIVIAQNLVIANPLALSSASASPYSKYGDLYAADEPARKVHATRLVIGMAIDAALHENDFETAYSFAVNRLSHSDATFRDGNTQKPAQTVTIDDISWRAAYQAGRHPTTLPLNAPVHERTRRLEQRMDLLSRALGLAPPQALPEVLAAWRRCEEELLTLLHDTAARDAEADELAERRMSGARGSSDLPGAFRPEQPALLQNQPKRKEVGRASKADGEAPMGLFDVARGAAQAFGRMGQSGTQQSGVHAEPTLADAETEELESGERVRKRDMVASAVTGGMAKGIGWVLGATPVTGEGRP
ncbi:MAG: hypothetical protein Q9159_004637 [Coniocarpon cinnabarinum]